MCGGVHHEPGDTGCKASGMLSVERTAGALGRGAGKQERAYSRPHACRHMTHARTPACTRIACRVTPCPVPTPADRGGHRGGDQDCGARQRRRGPVPPEDARRGHQRRWVGELRACACGAGRGPAAQAVRPCCGWVRGAGVGPKTCTVVAYVRAWGLRVFTAVGVGGFSVRCMQSATAANTLCHSLQAWRSCATTACCPLTTAATTMSTTRRLPASSGRGFLLAAAGRACMGPACLAVCHCACGLLI